MNKREMAQILALRQAAYPTYYRTLSQRDNEAELNLWFEFFHENEYLDTMAAMKAYIASDNREKAFPPSVGQIKAEMQKLTSVNELTEEEGWKLIRKAIDNASMSQASALVTDDKHRTSAQRNFEKLPAELQAIVHSPEQLAEWAKLDEQTLNSVIYSHYRKIFQAKAETRKHLERLPSDVRKSLEGMMLEGGAG